MMSVVVIAHLEAGKNHTDVITHKQSTNIFRTEGYATGSSAAMNASSWTSAKSLGSGQ
jgi:hypothetical protein